VAVLGLFGTAVVMTACAAEEAVPIDPANPPTVGVETTISSEARLTPDLSHSIAPTAEMEGLARQQCLDDPAKSEGYVRAVDPETGSVLVEFTIDCSEVRAGG